MAYLGATIHSQRLLVAPGDIVRVSSRLDAGRVGAESCGPGAGKMWGLAAEGVMLCREKGQRLLTDITSGGGCQRGNLL